MTGRSLYAGGHKVGVLCGDVLRKEVRGSWHQLRTPPAWAIDAAVLTEAEQAGAVWVELYDADTQQTWRAPLAEFRIHGFHLDRGHGEQIGLTLKYWHAASSELALQLGLFSEMENRP